MERNARGLMGPLLMFVEISHAQIMMDLLQLMKNVIKMHHALLVGLVV